MRLGQGMNWRAYLRGAGFNIHRPGGKPNIFIFATPRSGSTFLMELLGAQPGMKVLDEPLNANYPACRRELGITNWEDLTVMPNREEQYKAFFGGLLENRIKDLNRSPLLKYGRFVTTRVVIKNIHGGKDMLPWFARTFDAKIVVLLRHPIPTVLSHQKFPRLPYLLRQPVHRKLFSPEEVAFAEKLIKTGTRLEKGVIDWCLEIGAMFRNASPDATVISYEDLTVFPRESFEFLRGRLLLEPMDDVEQRAARASVSTGQSDDEARHFFAKGGGGDRRFLISRWRSRVSERELRRVFEICRFFGLDQYSEDSLFPTGAYRIPAISGGGRFAGQPADASARRYMANTPFPVV